MSDIGNDTGEGNDNSSSDQSDVSGDSERTDFDPSLLNGVQSTSQEGSQSVDLEKLKETYRDSVDKTKDGEVPNELDEIIKTYFDNIDPADLEKLKKAYLTYRKNNSLK